MTYNTGWQRLRRPATKNGRGWALSVFYWQGEVVRHVRQCFTWLCGLPLGPLKCELPTAGGPRSFHKTWASDICANFKSKGACVYNERCKFRHMFVVKIYFS